MNIQRFIETRKALKLSQSELCKGICTQATLSKFENGEQVPNIKIVSQLCKRLNLTLNDIFPAQSAEENGSQKILDGAEFNLITSEYQKAQGALKQIDVTKLNSDAKMQFYFLAGYLATFTKQAISDSLYYFNVILNDLDDSHKTEYTLLAYTGSGVAYYLNGDNTKAEFYFDKVLSHLRDLPMDSNKAVWRALNMLYFTGNYYAEIGDYNTSNQLLDYAYDICSDTHLTFYVARICFRKAQNMQAAGGSLEKIRQLANDAAAFARLNHNEVLLKNLESFKVK